MHCPCSPWFYFLRTDAGAVSGGSVMEFDGNAVDPNVRDADGKTERVIEGCHIADSFGIENGDVGGVSDGEGSAPFHSEALGGCAGHFVRRRFRG